MGAGNSIMYPQNTIGQFGNLNMNVGLDGQNQGMPRGHGRRHSVNVVNKTGGSVGLATSLSYGGAYAQEGFDDGFTPSAAAFGSHSRQPSRVTDSSWRISECIVTAIVLSIIHAYRRWRWWRST